MTRHVLVCIYERSSAHLRCDLDVQDKSEDESFSPVRAAWELVEQHAKEQAELKKQLEASEFEKAQLKEEMTTLKRQMQPFGDLINTSEARPSPSLVHIFILQILICKAASALHFVFAILSFQH